MGFIDSYKTLEKLCSEIYGNNHGLSSYIEDMINHPNGSYYVSGWNEDLKKLKHYRWVRNQIVHEPDCTEDSMCVPDDTQWLNDFYSRIMSVNDPLALYRKAKKPNPIKTQRIDSTQSTTYTYHQDKTVPQKPSGCFTYLVIVLVGVLATLSVVMFLSIIYLFRI